MTVIPKTIVLGLAGIAWDDLVTRVSKQQLPGIATLLARGIGLRLIDDVPDNRPAAWASLSSGLWPAQHRLVSTEAAWAGGLRIAGHADWGVAPVWRRLTDLGLRTASIAWPFTRPGAAWPGVHVDDHFADPVGRSWDDWYLPPGVVPDAWAEELAEVRVHPTDVTSDLIAPFVPALAEVDQASDRRLVDLALMIARLSTNAAAGQLLLARDEWDVAFLYHNWLAAVQERFGGATAPYDGVIDAAWIALDTIVATVVAVTPRDTTFVLVSAGFKGKAGVMAIAGPGVKAGVRADAAHSLDLVPTLLARYGVADPALPGRNLLARDTGELQVVPAIPMAPRVAPDAAALARVAAFGFAPLAPPSAWRGEQLLTLASLAMARDPAAAGRFAEQALALLGDQAVPLGLLAMARAAAGDIEALPPLADRVAAVAPDHVWTALIRGGYHAYRGEAALARPFLLEVEANGGWQELLRVAAAWLMLERPADARRAFDAVLRDAPDRVDALIGRAIASPDQPTEAEQALRRALVVDPASAPAREILADILRKVGRTREADAVERVGQQYQAAAG